MIHIREKQNGKKEIFDPIRKKYVAFTPEEDVRQSVVVFLRETLHIPLGSIGVEKACKIYGKSFRVDLQVFNQKGEVVWLIECKRREIPLSESVMEQICRYNLEQNVRFLMITNGEMFSCWKKNDKPQTEYCNMQQTRDISQDWEKRESLPLWDEIK